MKAHSVLTGRTPVQSRKGRSENGPILCSNTFRSPLFVFLSPLLPPPHGITEVLHFKDRPGWKKTDETFIRKGICKKRDNGEGGGWMMEKSQMLLCSHIYLIFETWYLSANFFSGKSEMEPNSITIHLFCDIPVKYILNCDLICGRCSLLRGFAVKKTIV